MTNYCKRIQVVGTIPRGVQFYHKFIKKLNYIHTRGQYFINVINYLIENSGFNGIPRITITIIALTQTAY